LSQTLPILESSPTLWHYCAMHTKESLQSDLKRMGVDPKGTTLAHFSYNSLGYVDGGAETVIDAFIEYMSEGLMVFATHTWSTVDINQPSYSVEHTACCTGIVPELARKRADGFRSGHPTHSVVAFGKDAKSFVAGDEHRGTPCARDSAWGRLLDRDATILLVGVGMNRDTFIHGIEEWLDVPGRLSETPYILTSNLGEGNTVQVLSRRHIGFPAEQFHRVEEPLKARGIITEGQIGDAKVLCHRAKAIYDALVPMLEENPRLFDK